jgi:hypothetical protein
MMMVPFICCRRLNRSQRGTHVTVCNIFTRIRACIHTRSLSCRGGGDEIGAEWQKTPRQVCSVLTCTES